MPRKARELSAIEVKRLRHDGTNGNKLHFVGGVSGLALQLLPTGGKTWILRTTIGNKRRDVGLGGYPEISLSVARERARETKNLVRQGVDPIEHRRELKSGLIAAQKRNLAFSEAVQRYLEAKASELKNQKHKEQWASTLKKYAEPELGHLLVSDITTQDILRTLQPIWHNKTETASRLRGRIEAVISWATVAGHRSGDNPARWAGNLKELLPSPRKIAKSGHWPALDIGDVSAWFAKLREMDGMGARALEFLTLCASRSGEVRDATWQEINLEKRLWVVPPNRMKSGREHRVPLTDEALKLLEALPRLENSHFVFHSARGGVLSDMSVSAVMRRMQENALVQGQVGWLDPKSGRPAVPHGLRSTFRDWAAENGYPREIAEIALAHAVGSEVERAYRRSDLIKRRRSMMNSWANFLSTGRTSNIHSLEIAKNA
ncbi:tyrosine-type recombinase/integrase [Roseibium sp. MMSF_3544]|uniref:tyrosine-type recombinase/integrase n=1 Tax=unclassified Roseibium TaxID=2629323 RepID=UPI00273F87E0|nr:tyrosine-type recombinase/integrase [Roseibium sp. MMSF_3544]